MCEDLHILVVRCVSLLLLSLYWFLNTYISAIQPHPGFQTQPDRGGRGVRGKGKKYKTERTKKTTTTTPRVSSSTQQTALCAVHLAFSSCSKGLTYHIQILKDQEFFDFDVLIEEAKKKKKQTWQVKDQDRLISHRANMKHPQWTESSE